MKKIITTAAILFAGCCIGCSSTCETGDCGKACTSGEACVSECCGACAEGKECTKGCCGAKGECCGTCGGEAKGECCGECGGEGHSHDS